MYNKLGVENGDIPDANFEASHSYSDSYGPHQARLNRPSRWAVDGSISGPWIQVDIGYSTNVSGLLTQGQTWGGVGRWITKLKVSTFTVADEQEEVFIKDENGADKVFIGCKRKIPFFPVVKSLHKCRHSPKVAS